MNFTCSSFSRETIGGLRKDLDLRSLDQGGSLEASGATEEAALTSFCRLVEGAANDYRGRVRVMLWRQQKEGTEILSRQASKTGRCN